MILGLGVDAATSSTWIPLLSSSDRTFLLGRPSPGERISTGISISCSRFSVSIPPNCLRSTTLLALSLEEFMDQSRDWAIAGEQASRILRLGVLPGPIHVLHGLQIEPDHVAGLDELRHHHFNAVGELRRLERAVRLLVSGGSGVRNFHLDHTRKQHMGRPAAYELDRPLHPRVHEGGTGTDDRAGDLRLLVVFGIHETTLVAVRVKEFERLPLDWKILKLSSARRLCSRNVPVSTFCSRACMTPPILPWPGWYSAATTRYV